MTYRENWRTACMAMCAACGKDDAQKISAVVGAGTWSGSSQTVGTGMAYGVKSGLAVGVGVATTSHQGSTALAQLLAVPEYPMPPSAWAKIPAMLGGGLAFLILLTMWSSGEDDWRSHALLTVVGVTLLLVVAARVRDIRAKAKFEPRAEEWRRRVTKWQELIYCARCHEVTDPTSGHSAPAALIGSLL
jgi:hypothetical protein